MAAVSRRRRRQARLKQEWQGHPESTLAEVGKIEPVCLSVSPASANAGKLYDREIVLKGRSKDMFAKTRKITGVFLISTAFLVVGAVGCTTSSSSSTTQPSAQVKSQTRNFDLYVRDTQVIMPDKKAVYAFGFTDDPNGHAKIPAPPIVVNEGDTVNITLHDDKDPTKTQNNPDGDGHTIHLHGLDMPSAMDGDPMTAPGGHSVLQGSTFLYHFVAKYPGTYWYHCHSSAAEHIQMGMYGALVIRPRGQSHVAYPGTPAFNKEYTFVLSDMDSAKHLQDYNNLNTGGSDVNWTQYQPDYFLINGKAWPDTMMDPQDNIEAALGQTVLVRLVNTGYVVHSMHSHGFHFLVIGSDGRKLDSPYAKDTLDIAPGERYEVIFNLNQVGRYMFHDHIEQNTTNAGKYPGGMMTMISVNNPNGSNPVSIQQMMSAS